MPRIRFLLVLACFVTCSLRAQAAPIVFDFEDGLQGWELHGASRHEVDVLGGRFAIFGVDFSSISIAIDLTDIREMTFDRLFTGDDPRSQNSFVAVLVGPVGAFGTVLGAGESLLANENNPKPNPDTRKLDLGPFAGPRRVTFLWNAFSCSPEDLDPCFGINFPGYVDNITFHPVPEPGTLALLAVSLTTLAIYRRRVV